jgi:UDP-N-acetylmuramate dehydrogenase
LSTAPFGCYLFNEEISLRLCFHAIIKLMNLKIERNVLLKNFTTFKIGGPARYFFVAKNKEDLKRAILWAKKKKLPFFILGGGSNVLFSDKGFNGLVIKMQNSNLKIQNENSKFKIICGAGVPLMKLVFKSSEIGATGLENLAGIPGTLGGAIWGNAGAFGREIGDVVEEVKVLDVGSSRLEVKKLRNKGCKFGYRDSIFKRKKNWIILEATLGLKRGKRKEFEEKIKDFLKLRKEKQPLEFPSAGSVFKNVPIEKVSKKIREKFKEKIKDGFLPAGVLIGAVGLKGFQIGGAKISEKHANFIVNVGNAKASDVKELIEKIKKEVKKKFKIQLEEEIKLVGF